jgi:hypothetical protein
MIFWRGKALYLYGIEMSIQESQRKLREMSPEPGEAKPPGDSIQLSDARQTTNITTLQ